jgi:glycosyltransferase involved in cell wall biosynthesis
MAPPFRIGFLHLGHMEGGISRYGRILAAAMRSRDDVEVIERSARATDGGLRGLRALGNAVAALAGADATLVQYSRYRLWADGPWRLVQLALVHLMLRGRAIVVLHDVPSRPGEGGRAEEWALKLNLLLARAAVVHGGEERGRLMTRRHRCRVVTMPHFIESRDLPDRVDARRRMGVAPDETVLGMLGWIHPRKNHAAAVATLPALGRRARLWLIGAPASGAEAYAAELVAIARRHDVEDRVEITGYVSDEDLNVRLAALDVALCPYLDASASGSLATLLAARKPVVASDLPAFREQHAQAGSLVRLVDAPSPERLAAAVRDTLDQPPAPREGDGAAPADFSPQAVAERYLDVARRA